MLGSKMLKTKHLGITNVATNAALILKLITLKMKYLVFLI